MAATYTAAKLNPSIDDVWGKSRIRGRTVTLAGTYTAGGDALTAGLFGLRVLIHVIPLGPATDGTLAYDVTYVQSSKKLKLWETGTAAAGSAEKNAAESLTGITVDVLAIGY